MALLQYGALCRLWPENSQGKIASVAMRRSIQGMLEELEPNLWEHVLCRLGDYGHTFSPEIEMAALTHGDELLHGEAVNIDMALTTQVCTSPEGSTAVSAMWSCAAKSCAGRLLRVP